MIKLSSFTGQSIFPLNSATGLIVFPCLWICPWIHWLRKKVVGERGWWKSTKHQTIHLVHFIEIFICYSLVGISMRKKIFLHSGSLWKGLFAYLFLLLTCLQLSDYLCSSKSPIILPKHWPQLMNQGAYISTCHFQ